MYNRCRRCYQQNNNTPQAIETLCNDVGIAPEYDDRCGCCQDNGTSCNCGFDQEDSLFPSNPMLAQSYVPIQYMDKTFTPCCGLKMGTIFPELVSPYSPCQGMREIEYLKARNEIGEGCNG